MIEAIWFERIPLWVMFIGGFATVVLGIAVGFALGTRLRRKMNGASIGPAAATVAGSMLGLLAFLLAFSFNMSASLFQARRQILLKEVNAIGTTFLRADQIPEPERTNCRELLKKYVLIRASLTPDSRAINDIIAESQSLQDRLWHQAAELARSGNKSPIDALFVSSLNELIDLHTARVTTALQYHIPILIWGALFLLAFLSMMALGYEFGLSGIISPFACCIVALGFSIALMMIADFDSITQGNIKVSQQPMIELRNRIAADSLQK